ncbi:MAG: hypothetical protein WC275_01945 [Bacilli bacterium]
MKERQESNLSAVSHNYLKRILPSRALSRAYRDHNWEEYPIEFKKLDRALTLFAFEKGYRIFYNVLFDYYVEKLTMKQIAEKYNYSVATIERKKKEALELFTAYIPHEER